MESIAAPTEGIPTMRVVEVAFRALADRTDECVFLTDRQGRYVALNGAFVRWVGRPESEILGRTAFDLWPGPLAESDAADDRRVLDGENVERDEQRPCGAETRQVRTVRIPLRDETGTVQGVLGRIRDMTPDKASEEARSEIRPDGTGRPHGRRRRPRLQQPHNGCDRTPGAVAGLRRGRGAASGTAGRGREGGGPGGGPEPSALGVLADGTGRAGTGRS